MDDGCFLRVYDKDLNWIGAAGQVESAALKRDIYGVGTFAARVSAETAKSSGLTSRGNIVTINGDAGRHAIVRGFRISEDRGGAYVSVRGETGQGFARQRRIVPPVGGNGLYGYAVFSGSAETVMKSMIADNMTDPVDTKRRFENVTLVPDLERGPQIYRQARFTTLSGELAGVGSASGVGWEIIPDITGEEWVADVIVGADRTLSQTERSPVTFRMKYRNIGSYEYTEDFGKFRNTGYAAGKAEDDGLPVVLLGGSHEGADRWETFLNCSPASGGLISLFGSQKLSAMTEERSLVLATLPRVFGFGKDYFLGDLVSVVLEGADIESRARVVGVREEWDRKSGYTCGVTLEAVG